MLLAAIMFLESSAQAVFPGSGVLSEHTTDAATTRDRGGEGEPFRRDAHDGKDKRLVASARLDEDAFDPNEIATGRIADAQVGEGKGKGAGVDYAKHEPTVGGTNDLEDAAGSPHRSAASSAAGPQELGETDERGDETYEYTGPDASRGQPEGGHFDRPSRRGDGRGRWSWLPPVGWGAAIGLFGMGLIGVRREDGTVARRASLVCLVLALFLTNALLLLA